MKQNEKRLDEGQVELFLEKLRARAELGPDVLEIIQSSFTKDKAEPTEEIARTLCELLEPERLGQLRRLNCKHCGERLEEWRSVAGMDACLACSMPGGRS